MNLKERKPQLIDAAKLIPNESNPRLIKDDKFAKLVKSLKEFPKMLEYRPVIVNADMIVLAGNMRLKAALEIGLQKIPTIIATDLTQEEQEQLIVKDNVGFGEWDWDMLANTWDAETLNEWGVDIPEWYGQEDIDVDKFFTDTDKDKENKFKIVLEYTEDEHAEVIEAFNKHTGSKEQIIYKLLGL
jgi:hypothetical protein